MRFASFCPPNPAWLSVPGPVVTVSHPSAFKPAIRPARAGAMAAGAIGRTSIEFPRRFYFDTVIFDPAALRLAISFAGADQLLAGSDYLHMIGSPEGMKASIARLDPSEADRAAILGGNAARLSDS